MEGEPWERYAQKVEASHNRQERYLSRIAVAVETLAEFFAEESGEALRILRERTLSLGKEKTDSAVDDPRVAGRSCGREASGAETRRDSERSNTVVDPSAPCAPVGPGADGAGDARPGQDAPLTKRALRTIANVNHVFYGPGHAYYCGICGFSQSRQVVIDHVVAQHAEQLERERGLLR